MEYKGEGIDPTRSTIWLYNIQYMLGRRYSIWKKKILKVVN